jgi:hypothetical protein
MSTTNECIICTEVYANECYAKICREYKVLRVETGIEYDCSAWKTFALRTVKKYE